jgi:peroxiredoxin
MYSIDWQLAAAVATVFSSIAFAISAIAVMMQLRQMARERYFSVTSHLFEIWQSPEFQRDQLFLLHELPTLTWDNFCAQGRGKRAERALHRVGGYYDRVGNLVRHNLIHKQEILPTIGGYAVAVWDHVEPLVKELRLRENAVLFQNYEALLPECHDCYVPAAQLNGNDFLAQIGRGADEPLVCATDSRLAPVTPITNGKSAVAISPTALELPSRPIIEMTLEEDTPKMNPTLPATDLSLPDSDGIARHLSEFTVSGLAVLVYARGAYCPFCLRQLSEYGERYRDFKRSGVEVVAISPETQRKSRRLRTGLKLPFPVLSDARLEAAKSFGLIDHEHPGTPAPATLVLDNQHRVRLSTLNDGTKSLLATDVLRYALSLKAGETPPAPQVAPHTPPPRLFMRAIANMVVGFVSR